MPTRTTLLAACFAFCATALFPACGPLDEGELADDTLATSAADLQACTLGRDCAASLRLLTAKATTTPLAANLANASYAVKTASGFVVPRVYAKAQTSHRFSGGDARVLLSGSADGTAGFRVDDYLVLEVRDSAGKVLSRTVLAGTENLFLADHTTALARLGPVSSWVEAPVGPGFGAAAVDITALLPLAKTFQLKVLVLDQGGWAAAPDLFLVTQHGPAVVTPVAPPAAPAGPLHYLVNSDDCREIRPDPSGCSNCFPPDTVTTKYSWWLEITGGAPASIDGVAVPLSVCSPGTSCGSTRSSVGSMQVSVTLTPTTATMSFYECSTVTNSSGSSTFCLENRCTLTGGLGGLGVDAAGQLVSPPMRACHSLHTQAPGGISGLLGRPSTTATTWGQGYAQRFFPGVGNLRNPTESACLQRFGAPTAYFLSGSIWALYTAAGGPTSSLGYPTSDLGTAYIHDATGAWVKVAVQRFEGGVIYQPPGQSAFVTAASLPQ